jgi:threonylcarbamoyladenosine tRNA methylthiotransferase MtaB
MEKKYLIKTFGCKANAFDSRALEHALLQSGWVPHTINDQPDICVINTCAVTDEATKQAKKMAKKMKKDFPSSKIVITGCVAEVEPEKLLSDGPYYVIGNQNKDQLVKLIENSPSTPQILGSVLGYEEFLSRHPIDREWPSISDAFFSEESYESLAFSKKTRAFLKIQEGCNSFCTFCIIPYARGPARSLSLENVINQVHYLCELGYEEIVLTGTNIGQYGADWQGISSLDTLIFKILDFTPIKRLRLSSLDPTEISLELIKKMQMDLRLCPHFHVSLQSPLTKILKLMKRRYVTKDVEDCLALIHSLLPHAFVGMDLITGFPGETEKDFEDTVHFLDKNPWTRIHVFPYSERSKTPATRLLNSVPWDVRLKRSRILNELSLKRQKEWYQHLCNSALVIDHVLMEGVNQTNKTRMTGITKSYARLIFCDTNKIPANSIVSAKPLDIVVDHNRHEVALLAKII